LELLKVIKFEGDDDTLVWKHPAEDFNTNSKLIVHESQEAILFKDGKALDVFGPGKYELDTQNIPLLRAITNIPTEGVSPFHCEVYFINKAVSLNMQWGTSSKFQILDPSFGILISVGASGSMEFQISDSRKFLIKVVGTQNIVSSRQLIHYFKEKTTTKVKDALATIMSEVSYLNITKYLEDISEAIQNKLNDDFDEYGVNLIHFYVSTIFVPDSETAKLKEVLNQKMEYGTLNFNWADQQMAEIAKRYASNEGMQNNVGGMVAQLPLAFAFGEMLKDNVSDTMKSPFSMETKAFKNQSHIDNLNSNSSNVNTGNQNIVNHENESSNQNSANQVEDTKSESKMENATKKVDYVFCPQCGNKLERTSKFCNMCGNKLITENKCPKCGNTIKLEDKFCSNCGNKLE
jgi:membrane protease subunit (stomatin/prohibitin family)